ncbi:unnamed protein product [Peniophora sp. CBMAI 1063]|nr:unnamed protein product [Peniophora sp. CBMAI 1063]
MPSLGALPEPHRVADAAPFLTHVGASYMAAQSHASIDVPPNVPPHFEGSQRELALMCDPGPSRDIVEISNNASELLTRTGPRDTILYPNKRRATAYLRRDFIEQANRLWIELPNPDVDTATIRFVIVPDEPRSSVCTRPPSSSNVKSTLQPSSQSLETLLRREDG